MGVSRCQSCLGIQTRLGVGDWTPRGCLVASTAFSPLFQEKFPSPQIRAGWVAVGLCRHLPKSTVVL